MTYAAFLRLVALKVALHSVIIIDLKSSGLKRSVDFLTIQSSSLVSIANKKGVLHNLVKEEQVT